jgi:hypothetical protein
MTAHEGKDDKQVDVSFTPPDQFVFTPPRTPMKEQGRITLERTPRGAAWKFVSAEVVDGGPQFDPKLSGDGKFVTITNKHETLGEWEYAVTVELDGRRYPSRAQHLAAATPPPVIQNET